MRKPSQKLLTNLASNVKNIRINKGLSQEQLAEKCGLHRTYIGSIER
ncbi:transcriptional regulator, partial [Pantoea agglomerans]